MFQIMGQIQIFLFIILIILKQCSSLSTPFNYQIRNNNFQNNKTIFEQDTVNILETVFQWKFLEIQYPTSEARQQALDNG